MKHIYTSILTLLLSVVGVTQARGECEHILCEICRVEVPDSLIVSDPVALFDSLPQPNVNYEILNLSFSPKVFSGYNKINGVPQLSRKELKYKIPVTTYAEVIVPDSVLLALPEDSIAPHLTEIVVVEEVVPTLPVIITYHTPEWLRNEVHRRRDQSELMYSYMIDNPMLIEYAYWDLPSPPVLLEEDRSFIAFLKKQDLPDVNPASAELPKEEIKQIHWLHKVGALLQFSQAYVSPNWYQGGNDYLSMLFNFNWNVQLNQVYHPNLLFQSDLNYKLAISSNAKGSYHKYSIAEDNFQYNLNAGVKAIKDWYYSFNLQFKTQLLNNYESDSDVRTASFLSPGDLNLGLGMSYSRINKLKTFQYTLTISPLSYNLKTCISDKVDHTPYNIAPDKKTKSEVGSNLDFNMTWNITPNISYKTRMFMFTDYHYYLADWENTFSFEINKFLSTQIYVHLRYDGSSESYENWKKFMMREILSFGLSYTFSTKP